MTYLTRMPLNPARRDTRRLLGSPQVMHAAVLAGFPPDAEDGSRTLWRVDRAASHEALLYILSGRRPDLTHLVEQAGWPTSSGWETADYRPLLDRLRPQQRWHFRLTANPVRSVRPPADPGGPRTRGSVKGHVTAKHQVDWLVTRTKRLGFTVPYAFDEPSLVVRDRRTESFPRNGQTVTLTTATFEGLLEVTDADLLRSALTTGIGRAKAYGCGLLTLAPPS